MRTTTKELAELLGIKVSTLKTRLRALGIKPEGYFDLAFSKVAYFSDDDVARVEASFKEKPLKPRNR
jgi:hypothetical protein